ncbi:MAG: hypothetical protein KBD43_16930 [Saprospiraceae bacterium]|nr:hypothetical protein [Saprospiraceae bacterium]
MFEDIIGMLLTLYVLTFYLASIWEFSEIADLFYLGKSKDDKQKDKKLAPAAKDSSIKIKVMTSVSPKSIIINHSEER